MNIISPEEIMAIGYPQGKVIGMALQAVSHYSNLEKVEIVPLLTAVLYNPEFFENDNRWGPVARELLESKKRKKLGLVDSPRDYPIYGADKIEEGALNQMSTAMRLPVTVAGALMPDAHQGYGLPIGGVLATNNAVIPFGVGVDIGCRMCLSVYDVSESFFTENESKFKRELIAHTKFGAGHGYLPKHQSDHDVLYNDAFQATPKLRELREKAISQLGTSGGGNHFVEWGMLEMVNDDKQLGIPKGRYVALLSHSGSRGLGATIADHYTRLAKKLCVLPQEAANLAWLDLNSEEGMEYWLAMNLAGDYASACHEVIHSKLTRAIGAPLLARVENHHNFAWKETHHGQEVIVHRKGATPAAAGVLGIIPGSMTAPGFLVRGKGNSSSLHSAAHGAGRQMSRTQAHKVLSREDMKAVLKEHGVTLIGAGLDEAPMAYKDIHMVMKAQEELVEVVAKFTPRMVRMADDGSRED